MEVYVLRHGKAGSRSSWSGPDELRPLTKNGRRQSELLADALAECGITRIVSSPYVRCIQSVEPLAERLGLPVETEEALAEETPLRESLRLVEKVSDRPTVLCTHGDVLGELLSHCERHGISTGEARMEKGSTWIFSVEHGTIVGAEYVPPPS